MGSRDETNNADVKEISMSPPPPYQCPEMWNITEDDFWRSNAVRRQEQYAQASQRWNHGRQSTTEHIWSLEVESRQLREKEDKLSRELMAVRSQAALVNETFNHESQRLSNMDVQHGMERQDLFEKHENTEHRMCDWFQRCRNQDGNHERQWVPSELIGKGPPEKQVKLPPLAKLGLLRQQPNDDDRVVAIIDADGTELDKLPDLGLSNERTTTISARTVLPPIKLRDPRRFHAAMKPSIYSITDGKDTGWISSMIQATGTLQKKKCQGCIAVGGDLYSKCGNCEWINNRCQGLEPLFPTNIFASRSCSLAPLRTRSRSLTPPKLYGLNSGSPTTANLAEIEALTAAARETSARAYAAHCNPSGLSVSGFKAGNPASMCEPGAPVPSAVPSLTASDATSYRRGSKASLSSCPTSREITSLIFRPMEFVTPSSRDITKESLDLRHNGNVYTYPPCIEGVPVDKITPNHLYWEPKWPDLRLLVEPILRSWEEKYQATEEASRRGEAVGSVKYQYGRQVNRGNRILKFLEQGAISPYQLLSKRFMAVGKGSITSYDTLFRLCETIESLAKYKADVEPVDWLRQRLHELIEAQGAGFNFSKTIHNFYNDPKLEALRQKSGFKSIGRPSGIKMPRRKAGSADEVPSAHHSRKRKSLHPYRTPPPADSVGEPSMTDTYANKGPDQKKQKAAARVLDSLETGEVSDVDSRSGAPMAEYDFGIYQIKTRLFISSGNVTQYWVWVPENSMFEHQVLVQKNPVVWSVHREPIDFSLRLKDVVKVSWNLKALRVYVVMSDRQTCSKNGKSRGDIMVAFKRENTLRRFVTLCRREEIELVEETWKKMEHLWRTMQSERLLAGGETRARACRNVLPSHSGSAVSKTHFWSYI